MDLYGRLEELQGMTRLLIDDVSRIKALVGEGNPDPSDQEKTHRRCYVRAVFALVEAFAEQHRRLLIQLAENRYITIPEPKLTRFREIKVIINEVDGTKEEQRQYLQIFEKIKLVYKTAGTSFGQELTITFGDQGWETFRSAMELRNKVTHPKRVEDCWIFEDQIQTVNNASDWFKTLQNEFVRVAREHRQQTGW
jgi:hypothetical protein